MDLAVGQSGVVVDGGVQVAVGDIEELEGFTLQRLRHSVLTHDAERGTSTPMLLARSRHASVRSLEQYARPGVDAFARHVAERDPAARRQG
ncbi:hypothetical protein [Streptomyces wuyuanensis]|uniref:hypothetical protein n=1 Tax=Streptomyces wuyuanensis TaxID=1196353 RepID=UPI003713C252